MSTNVVLLFFDDLNDWIGPLGGYPHVVTPNFDRLAAHGITFQKAYCAAPICNPSRCSLLLGRFPHETGIYRNKHEIWDFATTKSLVQVFAENGWETLGVGKVFHRGSGEADADLRSGKHSPPARNHLEALYE